MTWHPSEHECCCHPSGTVQSQSRADPCSCLPILLLPAHMCSFTTEAIHQPQHSFTLCILGYTPSLPVLLPASKQASIALVIQSCPPACSPNSTAWGPDRICRGQDLEITPLSTSPPIQRPGAGPATDDQACPAVLCTTRLILTLSCAFSCSSCAIFSSSSELASSTRLHRCSISWM